MNDVCGVCGSLADVAATVDMPGGPVRYPMCMDCFAPIFEAGYADDVEMLTDPEEPRR